MEFRSTYTNCRRRIRSLGNDNGNENNTKVYYSLVSRNGETLRKGQMSISKETFMEYMEKIGFEYVDSVNVGDVLKGFD